MKNVVARRATHPEHDPATACSMVFELMAEYYAANQVADRYRHFRWRLFVRGEPGAQQPKLKGKAVEATVLLNLASLLFFGINQSISQQSTRLLSVSCA